MVWRGSGPRANHSHPGLATCLPGWQPCMCGREGSQLWSPGSKSNTNKLPLLRVVKRQGGAWGSIFSHQSPREHDQQSSGWVLAFETLPGRVTDTHRSTYKAGDKTSCETETEILEHSLCHPAAPASSRAVARPWLLWLVVPASPPGAADRPQGPPDLGLLLLNSGQMPSPGPHHLHSGLSGAPASCFLDLQALWKQKLPSTWEKGQRASCHPLATSAPTVAKGAGRQHGPALFAFIMKPLKAGGFGRLLGP